MRTIRGLLCAVLAAATLLCAAAQITHLGGVEATTPGSDMSEPLMIKYVIQISDSAVPGSEENSVPVSPGTLEYNENHLPLNTGALAAIAAGVVAVIGGAVWLILRNRRK